RERAAAELRRGAPIRALYARAAKLLRSVSSLEGRALDTTGYRTDEIRLPGAQGLVTLDYVAFDPATARLWVPAGNTGAIDVIETATVRQLGGQATAEFELRGKRGRLGPSSVAVGED